MVNGLISTLVAFLMGGATLSFNFNAVDAQGTVVYDGKGTTTTVGNSWRMEIGEALIVSDGSVKGIYLKGIDEIVLMPVAPDDVGDIMDNPFALLQNPGSGYAVSASDADSKGIPRKIVLKSPAGQVYTIQVLEYSALPAPDPSLFVLDPDKYPNAVVTDLR